MSFRGWMKLLAYGAQDIYIEGHLNYAARNGNIEKVKKLLCEDNYNKKDIKDAINVATIEITEILARYYIKKIIDIRVKKRIWGFVFIWITKPITKDRKLGIDLRLGLKYLNDLEYAPLYESELTTVALIRPINNIT